MPENFHPTCEADFFGLLLTEEITYRIVDFSGEYAWMHILHKQYYAAEDGSWREIVADDIRKLIGLLLYMGLVPVKNYEKFWCRASLFHVLWARAYFNSRDRFKAIQTFLHVDDPDNDTADRTRFDSSTSRSEILRTAIISHISMSLD